MDKQCQYKISKDYLRGLEVLGKGFDNYDYYQLKMVRFQSEK